MAPVVFAASAAPWAAEAAVFLAVPVLFLDVPVLFLAAEAADFPDAELPAVAAFLAVLFLPAVFLAAAFVAAVFAAGASVPEAVPTGFAPDAAGAACAFFFPPVSLAAAFVDLPDADCCTAVFFATMAAAPSHIVILLANRAGTINRLPARGNGASPRFARHASPARRVCLRCAQLPAG
ncbi:hypothetical protein ACF07B_04750 [Streptomyces sp. NPDC015532]|uniref:hypothetical protein n=1 Tax=unclassified Streptomyces TaxID=2593676 RepID=UPI0036F597DF